MACHYAVLIDLSNKVADEVNLPTNSISIEMVFQGNAADVVTYLTAPENRDLGVVKSTRPS